MYRSIVTKKIIYTKQLTYSYLFTFLINGVCTLPELRSVDQNTEDKHSVSRRVGASGKKIEIKIIMFKTECNNVKGRVKRFERNIRALVIRTNLAIDNKLSMNTSAFCCESIICANLASSSRTLRLSNTNKIERENLVIRKTQEIQIPCYFVQNLILEIYLESFYRVAIVRKI